MANTTIQEMYAAVRNRLAERFPQVAIMEDETAPPEQTTGFRMKLQQTVHSLEMNRRYRRTHTFVIQYALAPEQSDSALATKELYDTAELLTDSLEWIEAAGRKVRGFGMQFEVSEKKLKFQVEFSYLYWKEAPSVPGMENLQQEGRIESER